MDHSEIPKSETLESVIEIGSASSPLIEAGKQQDASEVDTAVDDYYDDGYTYGYYDDMEPPGKYKLEDDSIDAENPDEYELGGLHPVLLGDCLGGGGRFRVVHKLGHGGYGTVWLCHDKLTKKWRAVKVVAARFSKPEECQDFAIAKYFADVSPEQLAKNNIAPPFELFWIDGPNGRHLCAVIPLLGPRVESVWRYYGHCTDLLKHLCWQVVEGLGFIHSRGICHGDLRPQNILFRLVDGIEDWAEEEILKAFGAPKITEVSSVDGSDLPPGVPKYLVHKPEIPYSSGLCRTRVAITDFGCAYPFDDPPHDTGIPTQYCAPEGFLRGSERNMGPPSDIWSLGCTITKIFAGLEPFSSGSLGTNHVVQLIEGFLGPMPTMYRAGWKELGGQFRHEEKDESLPVTNTLWQVMTNRAEWEEEGENFQGMLHASLCGFGGRRLGITALQALEIECQDFRTTGKLPTCTKPESERPDWEDCMLVEGDRKDIDCLYDLLKSIFHWEPSQRYSLDDIQGHEWFGVIMGELRVVSSFPRPMQDMMRRPDI